ncbi:MAG: hypothetical protein CML29_03925 [Rhizobiales bacterium]|nr:hypothetical protein [Hyphomicrobiales bacterium]MBA70499.1 hypothetical protein [Hyphomicrobiales bacterium]|tara:strand:+ start:2218 stop:3930 length:1713 start_codon:yes stop_codon:yes gene_type:complete
MTRKQTRLTGHRAVNSPQLAQLAHQALSFYQTGRLHECEATCRRMLAIDAEDPNANLIIGILAFGAEQYDDAIRFFRTSIARDRKNADAHANLGLALAAVDQPFEARASLQTAIRLKPSAPEAYVNLANIESKLGYLEKAVPLLAKAVELAPRNIELLLQYGHILMRDNDAEKAAAQFRRVLAIDPADKDANLGLGTAYRNLGNFEEAEKSMRKVAASEEFKSDFVLGLVGLSELSEDEIAKVAAARDNLPETSKERPAYDFALSDIEHKRGNFESAARHLRSANAGKRRSLEYDRSKTEDEFDQTIAVFNADFFAQREGFGCPDETPIFVLGMPRSGTTLTEQILASHPDVYGAGELATLNLLKHKSREYGVPSDSLPEFAGKITRAMAARLGQSYIERVREFERNVRFIVDKMPHNFLRIGLIRLILPNSRIIHCLRDAREVCLSNYRTNFTNEGLAYSYDLDDLIHYYGLYRKIMDHWYSLFGADIIEMDHAKMVKDPEAEIRRLLAACDLEFVPECLEFHKTKRSVQTASVTQVRQPIYDPTKRGWRKYADYLPELHALDKYADPT